MNMNVSTYCNVGDHGKCSGLPPSPTMAQFIPPSLRGKACACDCHNNESTNNKETAK